MFNTAKAKVKSLGMIPIFTTCILHICLYADVLTPCQSSDYSFSKVFPYQNSLYVTILCKMPICCTFLRFTILIIQTITYKSQNLLTTVNVTNSIYNQFFIFIT